MYCISLLNLLCSAVVVLICKVPQKSLFFVMLFKNMLSLIFIFKYFKKYVFMIMITVMIVIMIIIYLLFDAEEELIERKINW